MGGTWDSRLIHTITMPDSEFLSLPELRDLTGYARRAEQAKVLREIGLPFQEVGGRVVVSRYHAREWLAGRQVRPSQGIDLAAVR